MTKQLTWPALPLNPQPLYNEAPAKGFAVRRFDGDGNRIITRLRLGLSRPESKTSGRAPAFSYSQTTASLVCRAVEALE